MRAVVQRVSEASVRIAGETVGKIGKGFLILLGVTEGYHDPDMESTLAAARKSGDRSALCKQFAEQMPFIPIAFEREQVIIRKNLINGFSPVPYSVFFGQENWTRVYAAESGSDAQTDEAAQ